MSTTGRPRKARVSSSGESMIGLPHSMGVDGNLRNLRELFSHLLLCHKIRLFENPGRVVAGKHVGSIRVYYLANFGCEVLQGVLDVVYASRNLGKLPFQLVLDVGQNASYASHAMDHISELFNSLQTEEYLFQGDLAAERCFDQLANLDAFVSEQGRALSISDFEGFDTFVVQYFVSGLHLTNRLFESAGLGAQFVSCHLNSPLDRRRLDCLTKPVRD